MKIETTCFLPTNAMHVFDKYMLEKATHFKPDDCELLWNMYLCMHDKLRKKCNTHRRFEKFEELCNEFMSEYERCKKKEEDSKRASDHPTKMPFYSIYCFNQRDQAVFCRFRSKVKFPKRNNGIQKVF